MELTDQQIIERLAVEVMGWEKRAYASNMYEPQWIQKPYGTCNCKDWNPLTDWNHWRQVEEKVMEDKDIWSEWVCSLWDITGTSAIRGEHLLKADLPTRCKALLAALDSLK